MDHVKGKGETAGLVLSHNKWFEKQSGYPITAVYNDGKNRFKTLNHLANYGVHTSVALAYSPRPSSLSRGTRGITLLNALVCLSDDRVLDTY